jgi:hippurate hydrolase
MARGALQGRAGTVPVHNPGYVFDDAILPTGAALLARMVAARSPL